MFEVTLSVDENGKRKPEYTLESDLNGTITLQDLLNWTKTSLIVIADQTLTEEQAKGFDKNPILIVDGRKNKQIQDVSPLGKIEIVARMDMGEILLDTYESLIKRSKVLTGAYISSHYVFHNGHQVATDLTSLKNWISSGPNFGEGDSIRIVNIQPYARRLELLGVTAQRSNMKREDSGRRSKKSTGKIIKLPNGAYMLTVRSVRNKYKHNAGIRFTFLPGSSLGLTGKFKSGRSGKNSSGRPYLYPTILFTVSTRGIS